MAGFDDIVKKAFYMGVGFAAYAQEKAGDTINELNVQARKLADEMIARGEMTTEEARKFVDDIVQKAQQDVFQEQNKSPEAKEPRRIEIVSDDEANTKQTPSGDDPQINNLRQQVQSLQDELRRLKQDK